MACPYRKVIKKNGLFSAPVTGCKFYEFKYNKKPDNRCDAQYCFHNDISNKKKCPVFGIY